MFMESCAILYKQSWFESYSHGQGFSWPLCMMILFHWHSECCLRTSCEPMNHVKNSNRLILHVVLLAWRAIFQLNSNPSAIHSTRHIFIHTNYTQDININIILNVNRLFRPVSVNLTFIKINSCSECVYIYTILTMQLFTFMQFWPSTQVKKWLMDGASQS